MRAVRLHDKSDLRFEEIDMALTPNSGEVRVKVAFAGICGSDIHNFKTGQWITRKPSTAGHEFSGWIDTVGEGVSGLDVGDKIVADSRYFCRECIRCRTGDNHLCENLGFIGEAIDGGFAEYVTVPADYLIKCKSDMSLDVVALAEPLAVALHALKRIDIGELDPLFVIGCGPIGALIALASNLTSERENLICDQNTLRVEKVAQASNATAVTLANFDQFVNSTNAIVSHVIDTTGNVDVIGKLVSDLSGATLGLVGIGSGTLKFDPVEVVERELIIVGCHAFQDELHAAIDLLETHPERFDVFIEHRIALEDTPEEYGKIVSGQVKGIKTLIEINLEQKS